MRAAAALAVAVAMAACLGLTAPRDADLPQGQWLWLEGVPGESDDGVHGDAIALDAFRFGINSGGDDPAGAVPTAAGGPASPSPAPIAGIEVKAAIDKATPLLLKAAVEGRAIPAGQLVISPGDAACPRIVLDMEGIRVMAAFIEGDPDRPLVTGHLYSSKQQAVFSGSGCPAALNRLDISFPDLVTTTETVTVTQTATSTPADLHVAILRPADGSVWPADAGTDPQTDRPMAVVDLQGEAGADVETVAWSASPQAGVLGFSDASGLSTELTLLGPPACSDPPAGYDVMLTGTAGVWDDTDIVHVLVGFADPCPAGIRILQPEDGQAVVSEAAAGSYSTQQWVAHLDLEAQFVGASGGPWAGPTPSGPVSWRIVAQDQGGEVRSEPEDGLESAATVRGVPECDEHVLVYKVEVSHEDRIDAVEVEVVGDNSGCP